MKLELKSGAGVTTTEFWFSIGKVVFCAAIALGWIDPATVQQGVEVVQNNAQQVSELVKTAPDQMSILVDGAMKMIALLVGGNVAANYAKSRGAAKAINKDKPENE